jgi:autotransporter-associated beta strand protein
MNGFSDTVAGLTSTANHTTGLIQQGAANLTVDMPSGTHTYSGAITGTGTFTKQGAGTQVLSGGNTLGPVDVQGGALFMHGANTTGPVTVQSGATLGASGSLSGDVVVQDSAHLAPGASTGLLTTGGLTLNAGSILDFELGQPLFSDRINVTGALALNGGTLNVTNFDGQLDYVTYTLFNYGSLTGSVANLSMSPAPEGFAFELVDTGTRINLVVSVPGIEGDFNDDGSVDAADHIVWRKFHGSDVDLPNDGDMPGPIGSAEYGLWQENFAGQGAGGGGAGNVPEPASLVFVVLGVCGLLGQRRRPSWRGLRQFMTRTD